MYDENRLLLTLLPEDDSIFLSEPILDALGWPKHLQLLVNEEKKAFLVRGCDIDDVNAIVVPKPEFNQCQISGRMMLRRFKKILAWENNSPRIVFGNYISEYNAVHFDLTESETIQFDPSPNADRR